ncbi:hypothetical protein CGLO_16029 [Colletotrichum gloeosporioides Cg-14]|uniref:Uncharacterized protein n=1 Tax=Colletotrichum gloeosporioides (strain Cg-14) TaxID=1237896 RepID=T0K086_COLGC|nr:hypothetical protein CGLO_16029 [Colletotrichum gloeosporioides Cg-14]
MKDGSISDDIIFRIVRFICINEDQIEWKHSPLF